MPAPNELWIEIIGNAVTQDAHILVRLQRVNKQFYELCQTKLLWYYAYRRLRPKWTSGIRYDDLADNAWKQQVLQMHKTEQAWRSTEIGELNEVQQAIMNDLQVASDAMHDKVEEDAKNITNRIEWLVSDDWPKSVDERDIGYGKHFANLNGQKFSTCKHKKPSSYALGRVSGRTFDCFGHTLTMQPLTTDAIIALEYPFRDRPKVTGITAWQYPDWSSPILQLSSLMPGEQYVDMDCTMQLLVTELTTTQAGAEQIVYSFYSFATQPLTLLHRWESPVSFFRQQSFFLPGRWPEFVLIGLASDDFPDTCTRVIRISLDGQRTLTIDYADPYLTPYYDQANYEFNGILMPESVPQDLHIWSATSGQLVAQLDPATLSQDRISRVCIIARTMPLIIEEPCDDGGGGGVSRQSAYQQLRVVFGCDTSYIEGTQLVVWSLRVPTQLMQTLSPEQFQRVPGAGSIRHIPAQPKVLTKDSSERVHLQRLYRISTGLQSAQSVYSLGTFFLVCFLPSSSLGYARQVLTDLVVLNIESGTMEPITTDARADRWTPVMLNGRAMLVNLLAEQIAVVPVGMMRHRQSVTRQFMTMSMLFNHLRQLVQKMHD